MEATIVIDGKTYHATNFTQETQPPVPPPAKKYNGWRCIHQAEGGRPNPDRMPIVRPSLNINATNFTEPVQLMSYAINDFNSLFTKQRWTATYGNTVAFTNGNGFGDSGDPRANFVERSNLTSPLPKLMKAIICGGNFFTGVPTYSTVQAIANVWNAFWDQFRRVKQIPRISLRDAIENFAAVNILSMTPGVDGVDVNRPLADTANFRALVLLNHWYFHATTRAGMNINNFPQSQGNPLYIPYVLSGVATYPLTYFEEWHEDFLPDPLKYYMPTTPI